MAKIGKPLEYTVHDVSGYSPKYPPNGILVDNPNDPNSRWSSESYCAPQYITLKLVRTSIVTEIHFGKYKTKHVCNVKRFKVFGGMTEESMIEILDEVLTNDENPETFQLKHQIMSNEFPCRYVKILMMQTWGRIYNFSLWFVELKGYDDCILVKDSLNWLNEFRQREAIRLCLKHLRQKNCSEAFESLQKRTKIQLEDQLLTRLHKLLVIEGDFDSSEKMLQEVVDSRLFDPFIRKQEYRPIWKRLLPKTKNIQPGMRGGHQMCIDCCSQIIYLFGGWDGTQDLADLWSYDIGAKEWCCISRNTCLEGGPSARSCHKMCLDPIRKKIYTLGRYPDVTSVDNLKSDFYIYDIQMNKWSLITDDTTCIGGPPLVFDHQMSMDLEKNIIYVFGGRIFTCSLANRFVNCVDQPLFSGLYIYNVNKNQWNKLRDDCLTTGETSDIQLGIKSRIGHSMLFHQKLRLLYIFGGQRHKEYLNDFFTYNVDTNEITVINDGHTSELPASGYFQRATIDEDSYEIHVLAGLNIDKDREKSRDKDKDKEKESESSEETIKNSFWIYDILDNRWSCIYRNDNSLDTNCTNSRNNSNCSECDLTLTNITNDESHEMSQPCPRYAHQLVYDHFNKCHYLFGGNPGKNQSPKLRLDDFWILELKRLSTKELLRKCKRLVREQTFKELIQRNGSLAIKYLQNELSSIFNHSDPEEKRLKSRQISTNTLIPTLIIRTEPKCSTQSSNSFPKR
ncbi:muskelin-like isoform X2 [Oppia nitens]|uniref:muskelin-like isoform X2 n=1 Tax=Oppia nitens TaxID=1686743 RepID=UPI0023DC7A13|nr:muskelin-like isoform X2 [Oppia nitens]